MSKRIEQLSKNLAQGMPRRKAFWAFFASAGAMLVGAKSAFAKRGAGVQAICVQFCRYQAAEGKDFGACVSASAHCPEGMCAGITNGGQYVCIPVV